MARSLLAACLLAVATLAAAQNFSPPAGDDATVEEIRLFVEQELGRQQVPGLAVGVVRGGKPLLATGFGFANVELAVPATARSVFQSGSLGKQFTAVLLMMLAEEGRLSPSDTLARWLPGGPPAWEQITLHHLLTHTSGIPDYTEGQLDLRRDYTEDELVAMAAGLPPAFAPGERWSYSNTGYVLLGAVIRRASGRFYGDLLAERVFGPLGMASARVISESAIVPHRADGYRLVDGQLLNQEWVSPVLNTTADGSLYLSLADMLAWQGAVRARALLSPAGWEQVFTPVRLAGGGSYPYGYAWLLDEAGGAPLRHHSGSWQGFTSYAARFEGADVDIVVFANSADAEPRRVVDGIARILDPALALPPAPEAP